MKNLITFGGPHQGVYGIPGCFEPFCDLIRRLLNEGAYTWLIQRLITQAQYWHDPLDEHLYQKESIFLADINQERGINQSYRSNLLKLKNFVMVMFTEDTIVQPKESKWFGFY